MARNRKRVWVRGNEPVVDDLGREILGVRLVRVGVAVVNGDVVRLPVSIRFMDGEVLGGFLVFDFEGVVGPKDTFDFVEGDLLRRVEDINASMSDIYGDEVGYDRMVDAVGVGRMGG